jgi:glutamate carboxypeptidase
MELTTRNQALWLEAKKLGAELGIDLDHGSAGGGSDGNTTSLYTATLDGLGAVGDGAHAHHEFLYIDKTIERTALLASLILAPSVAADVVVRGQGYEAKDISRLSRTHS